MNFNFAPKLHQDRFGALPRVGTVLPKPKLGAFPIRRGVPFGEQAAERGYLCGGTQNGAFGTSVERFVGRTETISTVSGAGLASYIQGGVGVNSLYKGFMMGGSIGGNTNVIASMPFNTEVFANLAATLGTARRSNISAGFCNPLGSGYNAGGFVSASVNIIDALSFVSETNTTLTATLSNVVADDCGVASSDAGYVVGGWIVSPTGQRNTTDKLAFNTNTVSTISALLNAVLSGIVGVQSQVKGYLMGGSGFNAGSPSGIPVNTIHSLAFAPLDTISVLSATMDAVREFGTGWSFTTRGYYVAGIGPGGAATPTTIENMIYATETSAAIATALNNVRTNGGSFNTPVNL